MFEDNRNRILTALLSAAGALLAFFGVRWVRDRFQQRAHNAQYQQRTRQRMQASTSRAAQEQRQDPARGGFPEGSSYQPEDQPDRLTVPVTGNAQDSNMPVDLDMVVENIEDRGSPGLSQQASTLVDYLLTFQDFITVLRERQRDRSTGGRSLTPDDRAYFQNALDVLSPDLEGYAEGNVEENSLEDRIYRLTVKIRDALQNLLYNDSDLFRINGEVRGEACRLLGDIQNAGVNPSGDFERVLEDYEC